VIGAVLYVLTALTFFAGTQLFVLSDHTDRFFSWTIEPPLTAAFLGAAYWAACVLLAPAARAHCAARAWWMPSRSARIGAGSTSPS
jgi:hypothetical protein